LTYLKILFSITILFVFSLPSFGLSQERPKGIVLPVVTLGDVTETRRQILQNTLIESLSSYYRLVPQDKLEEVQEKIFQEMDYDECTEDQCIVMIQEALQVENLFVLQVIGEGDDTQLSLKWVGLDDKKVRTDVCKNCNTFDLNDRIHKLLLLILGKLDIQDEYEGRRSNDWIRFTGNKNILTIYYKFIGNFGLGISSVTSEQQSKTYCSSYYSNNSCRSFEERNFLVNGIFLLFGYDLYFKPIVLNTNIGVALTGTTTAVDGWWGDYDRKINQTASNILSLNIGYRGKGEYGIGLLYSKIKQQGDANIANAVVFDSNMIVSGSTSNKVDVIEKTETRPVLWFGLNW